MSTTAPVISIDAPPLRPAPAVPGRRGWARIAKLGLGVLLVAMLTTELVLAGPTIASAAAELARSSAGWLAVAVVAALASMVAFAAVRRQTLRAAGVTVPLRTAVAVSYAAGAVHTTLPGGTVLSIAYAFRRLRSWGASTVVATWCLTVTGLLATATLAVIGLTGLLLGGSGSVVPSVAEIAVVLVAMAGIVRLTRNPDRLGLAAGHVLRWINRLRRRPAETGYAALATLIDDLQAIRPSRRAWLQAWVLSMLNWAFDAACLAACLAALGVHVGFAALLLTYTAGMAASSLTAVPGGLGVVEAALTLGLTTAGVPFTAALGAVLVYRILSLGGVVVIGWNVLAVQRLRSGATGKRTAPADAPRAEQNPLPSSLFRGPRTTTPAAEPALAPGAVPATAAVDDNPTVTDAPVRAHHATRPIHLGSATPDPARCDRAESVAPAAAVPGLAVRAREVMTGNPDQVAPTDRWQHVARTMRTLQASTLPVCDEHGDLCGIIDYRDIGLRCLSEGGSAATARSLTRDTPFTIGIDDPVDGIAQRMAEQKAWLLPVLDGRRLVGVIHYADMLTHTTATGAMTPTGDPTEVLPDLHLRSAVL
ncbi:MAG TPA: flippase-like domain-containing protein, partial [Mycobacterium sp.]